MAQIGYIPEKAQVDAQGRVMLFGERQMHQHHVLLKLYARYHYVTTGSDRHVRRLLWKDTYPIETPNSELLMIVHNMIELIAIKNGRECVHAGKQVLRAP